MQTNLLQTPRSRSLSAHKPKILRDLLATGPWTGEFGLKCSPRLCKENESESESEGQMGRFFALGWILEYLWREAGRTSERDSSLPRPRRWRGETAARNTIIVYPPQLTFNFDAGSPDAWERSRAGESHRRLHEAIVGRCAASAAAICRPPFFRERFIENRQMRLDLLETGLHDPTALFLAWTLPWVSQGLPDKGWHKNSSIQDSCFSP